LAHFKIFYSVVSAKKQLKLAGNVSVSGKEMDNKARIIN
jgi:hypothetical protein